MIITPRLTLVPASPAQLQAELSDRSDLELALSARIPDSWPPLYFDEDALRYSLRALETNPGTERWWFHYFILRAAEGDTTARTRPVLARKSEAAQATISATASAARVSDNRCAPMTTV